MGKAIVTLQVLSKKNDTHKGRKWIYNDKRRRKRAYDFSKNTKYYYVRQTQYTNNLDFRDISNFIKQ